MRIGIGIGEITGDSRNGRQPDRTGAARRARRVRQRLVRQHLRLRRDHGGGAVRSFDIAHRARHRRRADLSPPSHSPWGNRRSPRRPPAADASRSASDCRTRLVIESMFGLSFAKPYSHMREYLAVLAPLIRSGSVSFSGSEFRVNANLAVAGATPCPILIAALAPKMLALAGREGGRHHHLDDRSENAARAHRAAHHARRRRRPAARHRVWWSGLPIALTTDIAAAREAAGAHLPDLRRAALVSRHARPRRGGRSGRRRDRRRRVCARRAARSPARRRHDRLPRRAVPGRRRMRRNRSSARAKWLIGQLRR